MADTTFRTVFPDLKAVDNGDGTYSVAVSIPGMPPLTGLTAGEVLVALTSTTAGWQNTGVILSAPDISGVVTAAAALTMPAFAAGGAINFANQNMTNVDIDSGTIGTVTYDGTHTLNGQVFDAGAASAQINTTGQSQGLVIQNTQDGNYGGRLVLRNLSASPAANDRIWENLYVGKDDDGNDTVYAQTVCTIVNTGHAGGTEESKLVWDVRVASASNEAMTLSGAGALWSDLSVDTLTYKVSGTQVVGARVVDARCDDAINTGDATSDGVIDSLRDAMIAHGLIAAA